MSIKNVTLFVSKYALIVVGLFLGFNNIAAQPTQTIISDYVIFGGKQAPGQTAPLPPGYSVQLGSSNTIQGGNIGSYNFIQSTGSSFIGTNIFSGGTISLTNSNTVTGRIAAAGSTGTVISIGSNANISGNIDANGNIVVSGGTVSGKVTHPAGTTYTGPTPGGGDVIGTPNIPVLPQLPTITQFAATGNGNITNTRTIEPGQHGAVSLGNNKTLTLRGVGEYFFPSISNSGNSTFIFDFNNNPSGTIKIYVAGDVNLGKVSTSIVNGGSESRIYLETHGLGTTTNPVAFGISNGNGGGQSRWSGTVWAPYAAINIGSGTGTTIMTGALYSGTQVNIQSGVNIVYAPFNFCTPVTANAGPDQIGTATCGLTTVTLAANSPAPGTGKWTVVSGTGGSFSNDTSPTSNFTGIAGNAYTLRWTITNGTCPLSTDDVDIVFNQKPTATITANGPTTFCAGDSVDLTASAGSSWKWNTNATTQTIRVKTSGSYTVTVTSANGCTALSNATVVTENPRPNVNAGPDKVMNFATSTVLKGSSTTTGVLFSWVASNGGIISSGASTDEITVSSAGTYILTVTKSSTGCISKDTALVTSKVRSIIGSELQSIYENNTQESPFFDISNGYVKVDVIVKAGKKDFVEALLQTLSPVPYGLINLVTNGEQDQIIITGDCPVLNLPNLNTLDSVLNYVRPYLGPFNNIGLVSSAGDSAMRSNFVRNGYGLDGAGIKIGVLSDSYATITSGTTATLPLVPAPGPIPQTFTTNTASQDITNGDLPGAGNPNGYLTPVTVLKDFPIRRTDEGRAMLQIIHDVAPGAQLFFRTGFLTAGDFAKGIYELKDAGCDFIVDDLTYITEPYLKDGVVAKAADSVKKLGVTYISAAGNFANRSYEADFNPVDASSLVGFNGLKAHNFSSSGVDMFQKVKLAPGNYTIAFQWVDEIYSLVNGVAGTQYDMDIYLTPFEDGSGLIGFNRDNTNGDPIEIMPFTIPGTDSVEYNILIINSTPGNTHPERLKYIIYRGGMRIMEYNVGTSTLVGQANAAGAIAVGAARYDKVPPYLPVPELEPFSSIGGTKTQNVIRLKPDLVGPDGGNTTVKMGQDYPNSALDGYSNFFGTSAAAPHVTAAAALIKEGKKKFLDQLVVTPDEIKALLQATAIDMDVPGFDHKTGYGFIDVDAAMRTFAAPKATLIKLEVPEGLIPCNGSPFTITITGENFSTNTTVLLVSSSGDTTVISPTYISSTAVSVTINTCEGNPEILAYTPPKEGTNGTDGGYSNSLYFFDAEIVVNAIPVVKKYGEAIPPLETQITVNGVLLEDTTLTLEDIGLQALSVTTAANANSGVGTYVIHVNRDFDPNDPDDAALLVKYNYQFNNSSVTIEKMPLLITPNDITVNFGDHIGNITYTYSYSGVVPNSAAFLEEIKKSHEDFLASNALAVINGGTALTDGDLSNLNTIATLKAINNSRKFQVVNNKLEPLVDPNTLSVQYLVDVNVQSIFDYNANPENAQFYEGFEGFSNKAVLGATALSENKGKVDVNGSLVPMINGTLVPMINGVYLNGTLVQLINGSLVQFVNGQYIPIPNAPLVQLINGSLVQFVNGNYEPIPNGSLVQFVNGSLVAMINGSLVSMVNGSLVQYVNGNFEPIPNSPLVQLINGSLVQYVNEQFEPIANGALVQLVNGSLVSMINGSLQQLVNGTTDQFQDITDPELNAIVNSSQTTIVNGVVTITNGSSLVQLVNGSLVPMINGSLVQILNGSLVQFVNGKIEPVTNSGLVQIVNGSLVQIINNEVQAIPNNTLVQLVNGSLVAMVNGSLVSMVNGSLVQFVNDQPEPIANSSLVQLINGSLVQFVNGEYVPIPNNTLVQLVNGSLVALVNGSLQQLVNGTTDQFEPITNNAQLVSIVNGSHLSMVNNQLVSLVNGSSLVQLVNGNLVPLINGSLVSLVNNNLQEFLNAADVSILNGSLVALVNGSLVQFVNGQYEAIANGSLVSLVNGSLVPLINGSLIQLVNSGSIGAGSPNNNTAIIFDEEDVDPETNNWLGPMAALNTITGLGVGVQSIVPGTMVNPNFEVTNGLGKATILATQVVITPTANQTKLYGEDDPVFTFTNDMGLSADDFTGALARTGNNDVGTYNYTLGNLSAGPNYVLTLSTVDPVSTFEITKRPVTVTATEGQTKIYGNANPVYTYSITSGSKLAGDNFSGVLTRVAGEAVGTYAIQIGSLTLGSNYDLSFVSKDFSITQRPVTVTANAGQTKVYGSNDPAAFTYSITSGTKLAGDNFSGALTRVSGQNVGLYAINQGTLTLGGNYNLSYVSRDFSITKKTLTVTADNKTRKYGDPNPEFTVTYSGFAYNETLATSGVTGTPNLSTTATTGSPVGTYPITVAQGTLASGNYSFSFVSGTLTVTNNECLITHSAFKNFGNTPSGPTKLWMNMLVKISGQLNTHGAYILYTGGKITFNAIDFTPFIKTQDIPNGIVIADQSVTTPVTRFDYSKNRWVTRVPLGFSSTSAIFITGGIYYSDNGFVKANGNTNTVVSGVFYSSVNFTDQWTYGIAAYQTQLGFADLAPEGQVVSVNGSYPAGTPLPFIPYLVNGASGGNGNNYAGSTASFDNFSACLQSGGSPITMRSEGTTVAETVREVTPVSGKMQVFPNPASESIIVNFVPELTGSSRMVIYSLDGRKVIETHNGVYEKGVEYRKKIDVGRLNIGVYMIQMWIGDVFISQKLVVMR